MDLIEKVKGFLLEPIQAFETSKDETLEETVKYYLSIAAVYSLLSAILTFIIYSIVSSVVTQNVDPKYIVLEPHGIAELFSDFFISLVLMLICVFIWGALLHFMAYIMGGRWDITRTIKVAMYSSTPLVLLGWIPILGIFGWIWAGALDVVGLHLYQDLPAGKAIAAVMLPIVLLIILAIVILIVAVTTIIPMILEGISV